MEELNKQEIRNSAVEIVINFLSFILLGVIATATGILYFQVINKHFPDVLSGMYRNYNLNNFDASEMRYAMASLIIGFPIYLWMTWFWFRSFKNLPEKIASKLSTFLTYIVLLIAGGVIIGDLITIVYNFLQGEYSSRFLLKALTLLAIAGIVFSFYFFERKKIQYKKDISSGLFWAIGSMASILVILAIIFGFVVGGTPKEARIRNLDLQRTGALQELSSCINSFAYDNVRLPKDLNELGSNARYAYCVSRIGDPETKQDYEYSIIDQGAEIDNSSTYELCGEFAMSTLDEFSVGYYSTKWARHDKGRVCETQTATFGPQPFEKPIPLPAR